MQPFIVHVQAEAARTKGTLPLFERAACGRLLRIRLSISTFSKLICSSFQNRAGTKTGFSANGKSVFYIYFLCRKVALGPGRAFFPSGRKNSRSPLPVADKCLYSSDIRKFLEKIQSLTIEGFKRLCY